MIWEMSCSKHDVILQRFDVKDEIYKIVNFISLRDFLTF